VEKKIDEDLVVATEPAPKSHKHTISMPIFTTKSKKEKDDSNKSPLYGKDRKGFESLAKLEKVPEDGHVRYAEAVSHTEPMN